jgi:hypothetical protein
MTVRRKRPRDPVQLAKLIGDIATALGRGPREERVGRDSKGLDEAAGC